MEVFFTSEGLIALLTLATLEIVLGVDNLVFISIAVGKLPPERRSSARRFGLMLACFSRLGLLLSLAWLASMTRSIWSPFGLALSIRDLVLLGGGLFLLIKGVMELRESILGTSEADQSEREGSTVFWMVIAQIAVIDIVFSLDSVITAVGLVKHVPIMAAAIIAAVAVMLLFSDIVGNFIDRHPTIKVLALAFIVLVGVVLIADGLNYHIPRGYLYTAMLFSGIVESLNLVAKTRQRRLDLKRDATDPRAGCDL
ncbi:MAG: TerC family protein [Pseudomonadota bacterium]|nr:TerC family protein [Pseudomonadota bacterium]